MNFSSETQKIVDAHKGDFDYTNCESKLKAAGGYDAYINSLGGVFKKYRNFTGKVGNLDAFHEVCEYVFGLFAIYGFDYYNGRTYVRWTGGAPFYTGSKKGSWNAGKIDDLCRLSSKSKTTCCNWAIDSLLYKLGWLPNGKQTQCTYASYGDLVTAKADLRPGDIVHFYRDPNKVFNPKDTSTYSKSGWHHVVIVYDVTDTSVIVADGGSRMQRNKGQWLYEVPIAGTGFGGDYGTSDKWMARRIFSMATVTKDGKTTTDLALECILGRDINGATWGNNPGRAQLLGDAAESVQARINELLKDESKLKLALAKYILEGKAGSGDKRLAYLGNYYDLGQAGVNETRDRTLALLSQYEGEERELILLYLKIIIS